MNGRVMCGNSDHARPTPAAAQVEWLSGRFKPQTACWGCLERLLHLYVLPGPVLAEGPYAVTVTPVEGDRLSPCGTRGAYIRHLKRSEEPCEPCKLANAAVARESAAGDCPHCGRHFRWVGKHVPHCPSRIAEWSMQ